MDRTIVYPASIPQDTDILSVNRNAMIGIGYLAQMALGTNVVADGLSCSPTSPASMSVVVGAGSITSFGPVDINAYGSLPADTASNVVKMGINLGSTTFSLTAPTGSDTAINYLIEASFSEYDSDPVVLPYYNAANPSQPYSGPNNAGTAQNTLRTDTVQLHLVAGTPAPTGSQTTPPPDAGWVGLWVITVYNSMTAIGGGTISVYPQAPFLPFKLPQLTPGHSSMAVIAASQSWAAPFGTSLVKLRMVGGGGGGGAGGGGGGGGGAGGGYVEGYYGVNASTPIQLTVGVGGGPGAAGGTSAFGNLASAGGGGAGTANGAGSSSPGAGSGTGLLLVGGTGQSGFSGDNLVQGGGGGGSVFGPGGPGLFAAAGANVAGANATSPGGGGAGGVGNAAGGTGGTGLIILEW